MHTVSRRTGIRLYSRNRMFPFDIVKTGEAAPRSSRHGRCSMALARRLASPPRGRRSVVPRWRARCLRRLMTTNGVDAFVQFIERAHRDSDASCWPATGLRSGSSDKAGIMSISTLRTDPAMRSFLDTTNTPEDRHNLTARRWAGLKSLARLALFFPVMLSPDVKEAGYRAASGGSRNLRICPAHPAVFMVIFVYLVPAQIE